MRKIAFRFTGIFLVVSASCGPFSSLAGEKNTLDTLADEARAKASDALYIEQRGKVLVDWNAKDVRGPIELMSAVKSLVAIAVGRMLEQGELESLDQPVHTFYPEWKQGRKKKITVRHLLNHTSGLQHHRSARKEIYPAPDPVALALAAELDDEPGARFSYNNKAVNLLAGIIREASGSRMDLYFRRALFRPMGIDQWQWHFEESGKPHAMAGLRLYADDLARFGRLVLNDGMWKGERLLAEGYTEKMLAQGQPHNPGCGLLWWRLPQSQSIRLDDAGLASHNLPQKLYDGLASLRDREFESVIELRGVLEASVGSEFREQLRGNLGADWRKTLFDRDFGHAAAYYAEGFLGQYLVVVPDADLVAVRQIRRESEMEDGSLYARFPRRVLALSQSL